MPFDMMTFARIATLALLGLAAGCGVSYNSPSVRERAAGAPVTVVPLDAETVVLANAAKYTPRQLPAEFFATAGTGSGLMGPGALPAMPYLPDENRRVLELRPLPDVQPQPYRIGVGDVLLLATRSAGDTVEQLSGLLAAQSQRQGYTVRDDGSIAIPEIGAVQVEGRTLQQAEDQIFQSLVENQINPSFSLEVAEFNSQKVTVGGAVGTPALLPITPNRLTLAEALTAAGGITVRDVEFASIRVYRDGTLYQMPVDTYLQDSDLQQKVLLNGDAVFVDTSYDLDRAMEFYQAQIDVITLRNEVRSSALEMLGTEVALQRAALSDRRDLFQLQDELGAIERDYVYLSGEVKAQSRFALPFNQHATLADALYDAGGFSNTTGDPSQIYVLRGSSRPDVVGAITAYHLNARNAADMILATRFQLRPNDVIFIEEQPITQWNRALQQLFPTLINSAARSAI